MAMFQRLWDARPGDSFYILVVCWVPENISIVTHRLTVTANAPQSQPCLWPSEQRLVSFEPKFTYNVYYTFALHLTRINTDTQIQTDRSGSPHCECFVAEYCYHTQMLISQIQGLKRQHDREQEVQKAIYDAFLHKGVDAGMAAMRNRQERTATDSTTLPKTSAHQITVAMLLRIKSLLEQSDVNPS